jgi:hypothetical protein
MGWYAFADFAQAPRVKRVPPLPGPIAHLGPPVPFPRVHGWAGLVASLFRMKVWLGGFNVAPYRKT